VSGKIPCPKCGYLILPTTAERNDGLCAPCRLGTRDGIEEGKRWAREERELNLHDPQRKLWRDLVAFVNAADNGFSKLDRPSQLYFAVRLLIGEVFNGGFDQYFWNSSSDYWAQALDGLNEMGATHAVDITSKATRLVFNDKAVPKKTEERRRFLRTVGQLDNNDRAELERCDDEFCQDLDGLDDRIREFLLKHGLLGAKIATP